MPLRIPQHRPPRPVRTPDPRPSSAARGYGGPWKRLRLIVLRRDPVCTECQRRPSTEVDHVLALDKGGTNDEANLRGLCKPCHSRKTVAVDGGFHGKLTKR